MSQFQESLSRYIEKQKGRSPTDVQNDADKMSKEVQEYAPKERWGNIFKFVVAYALGIGLGHALAAALVRGADGLVKDTDIGVDMLSTKIQSGELSDTEFVDFISNHVGNEWDTFEDISVPDGAMLSYDHDDLIVDPDVCGEVEIDTDTLSLS